MNKFDRLLNIAHDMDALHSLPPLCKGRGTACGGGIDSFVEKKLQELKKERTDILKSLPLKNLEGEEKEIFSLRFIKGKAVRAIAKKMHYSPSAIHHKISKIRKKLRK